MKSPRLKTIGKAKEILDCQFREEKRLRLVEKRHALSLQEGSDIFNQNFPI